MIALIFGVQADFVAADGANPMPIDDNTVDVDFHKIFNSNAPRYQYANEIFGFDYRQVATIELEHSFHERDTQTIYASQLSLAAC
jgi:hypothetical protein